MNALFYIIISIGVLTGVACITAMWWVKRTTEERIRSIRAAYAKNRSKEQKLPTLAPEWSAGDVQYFAKFLSTPTGQKLLQRAHALEYANAITNAGDVFHTQHSAGQTHGFSECLKWLQSLASDKMLSVLTAAQSENPIDSPQDEGEEIAIRHSFNS